MVPVKDSGKGFSGLAKHDLIVVLAYEGLLHRLRLVLVRVQLETVGKLDRLL